MNGTEARHGHNIRGRDGMDTVAIVIELLDLACAFVLAVVLVAGLAVVTMQMLLRCLRRDS
jgi:hypothetical protein